MVVKVKKLEKAGAALLLLMLANAAIPIAAVAAQDAQENQAEIKEWVPPSEIAVPRENGGEARDILVIDDGDVHIQVENQYAVIGKTTRQETYPEDMWDYSHLWVETREGADFGLWAAKYYTDPVKGPGGLSLLLFIVKFDKIIEFVDDNNNGLYDKGEEAYIYDLENVEFAPIQYSAENIAEGVKLHELTIQTADGVFGASAYTSGEPVTIIGDTVSPNEVKITVEINNFPFTRDDSKLALKVLIKGDQPLEMEKREVEDKNETEIRIKPEGRMFQIIIGDNEGGKESLTPTPIEEEKENAAIPVPSPPSKKEENAPATPWPYGEEDEDQGTGFFSWKRVALVDGVEREVKSTGILEEWYTITQDNMVTHYWDNERKLYLTYERGTSIVHDPKIGFTSITVPSGITFPTEVTQLMPWALVIVAAILSALLSIGATRYIVLRRSI